MSAPLLATSIAMLCLVSVAAIDPPHPLSDEFIELINAEQTTWRAGRNFHPDTPMAYFKNLMGLIKSDRKVFSHTAFGTNLFSEVPKTFDSRDNWPHCPSLSEIRDQADCGSCWAFAAVEAMTDRICIHSNGTKQFHVSALDVITCGAEDGCHGNHIDAAWEYWESQGIVSGGNFGSHEGCKPYTISPCEHHIIGSRRNCSLVYKDTPDCKTTCQKTYNVSYNDDKLKGTLDYFYGEFDMIYEIFVNGPIECQFDVYEDFLSYKSGVYINTKGEFLGGHAVKVLGWGVENGVDYWLCANSWNDDWGDKGFFKVLRGEDHVDIETFCAAGLPIFKTTF